MLWCLYSHDRLMTLVGSVLQKAFKRPELVWGEASPDAAIELKIWNE